MVGTTATHPPVLLRPDGGQVATEATVRLGHRHVPSTRIARLTVASQDESVGPHERVDPLSGDLEPWRASVAQTLRTPHARSTAITSRIAASTTSLEVCAGARRIATTFAAGRGFFAA